jgi:hypothetical protein
MPSSDLPPSKSAAAADSTILQTRRSRRLARRPVSSRSWDAARATLLSLALLGARPARAEIAPTSAPPEASSPAAQARDPFDLTLRASDQLWVRPSALLQARYTFNQRAYPADGTANTSQFTVPRARFILDAGITQYLSLRLRVGTLADGGASFEQSYADLHLGPLVLRGGIFYLPASIADNPAPHELQALDYSQYAQQAGGGQAAGFGGRLNLGDFRAQAYLSNGARTAFSELATPVPARVALTARIDGALFTGDGLARFDDESSFRSSDFGLRLGAAAHYQKGAQSFAGGDLEQYTADVTLEGPGFNVIGAGRFMRLNPPEGNTTHDTGFMLQLGGFVHERIELWTRYDGLYSDGKRHATPPFPGPGTRPFHEVGVGINGYVVPRRNLAKLQLDFLYLPLPIDPSLAASSSNSGTLPTERGAQWSMRLQLNAAI